MGMTLGACSLRRPVGSLGAWPRPGLRPGPAARAAAESRAVGAAEQSPAEQPTAASPPRGNRPKGVGRRPVALAAAAGRVAAGAEQRTATTFLLRVSARSSSRQLCIAQFSRIRLRKRPVGRATDNKPALGFGHCEREQQTSCHFAARPNRNKLNYSAKLLHRPPVQHPNRSMKLAEVFCQAEHSSIMQSRTPI